MYLIAFIVMLAAFYGNGQLAPNGENVCSSTVYHISHSTVSKTRTIYTTRSCLWRPNCNGRISKLQTYYTLITSVRRSTKYSCCPGTYRFKNKCGSAVFFERQYYSNSLRRTVIMKCFVVSTYHGQQFYKMGSPNPIIAGRRIVMNNFIEGHFEVYTLQINNIQESDFGIYECRASDGKDPKIATTTFYKTRTPKVYFVFNKYEEDVGSTVNLGCYVRRDFRLKYIKKPSGELTTGNRYIVTTRGDFVYMLKIEDLKESDYGTYECKAEKRRTVLNDTTQLLIKPSALLNRRTFYLENGKPGTIEVTVRGMPRPTVTWEQKQPDQSFRGLISGMMGAASNNDYRISSNGSLIILHVLSAHTGEYRLKLNDPNGVLKFQVKLQVYTGVKPILFNPNQPKFNVKKGGSFQVECTFRGFNISNVTWRYGTTGHVANGIISITNVTRDDEGFYNCSSSNVFGTTTESFLLEHVIDKAKVSVVKKYHKELSEAVQMICSSYGYPSPRWQWLKGTKDGNFVVIQNDTEPSNKSTWNIQAAKLSDSGIYKCVADYGTVIDGSRLTSNATTELIISVQTCTTATTKKKCSQDMLCYDVIDGFFCRCKPGYVSKGQECKTGHMYEMTLRFQDVWNPEYSNSKSKAFFIKAKEYESIIEAECKQDGCEGVAVIMMRQGSIIVTFTVAYSSPLSDENSAVQALMERLRRNKNMIVTTVPNAIPIKRTTPCDVSGKTCGENSYCFVSTDRATFYCKCKTGFKQDASGKCISEEGKKEKLKESKNIVPIVAPICAVLVVVLAIIFFVALRKKRMVSRKPSQMPFDMNGRQETPLPNHYDAASDVRTGARDNNAYQPDAANEYEYASCNDVRENRNGSNMPSNGHLGHKPNMAAVDKDSKEPVYALYDVKDGATVMPEYATISKPGKTSGLYTTLQKGHTEPAYEPWRKPNEFQEEPFYDIYGGPEGKTAQDEPVYAIYGVGHSQT